jgi:cell wall assembly regulator SMI1
MWGQLHAVDAASTAQGAERGAEWLRFMGLKGRVCVQRFDFLWEALWENAARIQALQLCWKDLVLASWDPHHRMKRFAGPKLVHPQVLNPGRVGATLKKLRKHLERHANGGELLLAPGSPIQEVKRVEESIGMEFPVDFVEFLCAQGGTDAEFGPIGLYGWLTLRAAFGSWQSFRSVFAGSEEVGEDPIGPMKPYFLHSGWFPLIGHGSGTHVCVDMAPEHGGSYGQIVQVPDAGEPGSVLASGIAEWLDSELGKIESGQYVWDRGIFCEKY